MSEIDSTLVYMNLSDAQKFFELGNAVTNIEIRVQDVYHAQSVAQDIQRQLGFPYLTEDWSRLWPNLFSALRLEKTVYFLVLLLMVLIGAFQYYIHLDYGCDGEEEGYCHSSINGRESRQYSKDFPNQGLRDRRCGNAPWRGLGAGHLHVDSKISLH